MRGRQLKIQTFLSWLLNEPQRRADYTAAKRKLTNKEKRLYQQKGIIPKDTDEELLEH
jgi:GrpB-like predicted nucleotidyltransferase (UPF0157 family)